MRQSPKGPFIFIAAILPVCVQQARVSCPTLETSSCDKYVPAHRNIWWFGERKWCGDKQAPLSVRVQEDAKPVDHELQAAQGISSPYSGL